MAKVVLLLPKGEIGVLCGQFGKVGLASFAERAVQRSQFGKQNAPRLGITRDAVCDQRQYVFVLIEAHQIGAKESPRFEIKRPPKFFQT